MVPIFMCGPGRQQASLDPSVFRGRKKFLDPHPFHTVFKDEQFFILWLAPASRKETESISGKYSHPWGVITAPTLVING